MAQWTYEACPKCPSSDAFAYKEGDEYGQCFSCGERSPILGRSEKKAPKRMSKKVAHVPSISIEEILEYEVRGFQERNIRKNIAQHYGVRVAYDDQGNIVSHFYPYTKAGKVVGFKQRELPKSFRTHGDFKDVELFGQNVAVGGKRIVITEGELDCLAVAQAQFDKYGRFYPVVSVPSASSLKGLVASRDFLRNFDEVVLMLDRDDPGQKATEEAAKIIGFDKVKIAILPEKDPCDVLLKHGSEALMSCVFNARSYSPADVVKGEAIWTEFRKRQDTVSVPYPPCMKGVNEKINGMRMGEIALFTSGTGSGKSTVIKEIVLHIRKTKGDMVGMISLEESVGDTAEKFIGMKLEKNLAEDKVTQDELYSAFKDVFGDEKLILLDHQGSVSDASLTDKIELLALMGCKYLILDHITIAVSEGNKNLTGNEAVDAFMSDLLKIVKKHNIWLGVISHLRKGGPGSKPFEEGKLPSLDDIKGSGSIKQISFDILAFARNMVDEDEKTRNTIKFRILKSRFSGNTGNAGAAYYDRKTGRLKAVDIFDFE